MVDNLAQLDQGGGNCQWARVYLGPTIGWQMLPVVPELLVLAAGSITIPVYASRVLLKAAVTAVQLPDVSTWMSAQFQVNRAAFDRSLWVKDLIGSWTASPCTFTPFGTQKIDTLASYQAINNFDLVRFYPLTDLSGWYTG